MRKLQIKSFIRKFILLIGFVLFVFVLYTALLKDSNSSTLNGIDRKYKLQQIDALVHKQSKNVGCKLPKLPTFSPEIMRFVHEAPPINCALAGFDWVKCRGFGCRIQDQIKLIYGSIKCTFTDIIRVDDFTFKDGKTTQSDSYYKLEDSDVVRVSCASPLKSWSATLTGIRESADILERTSWKKLPKSAVKLNVLMLGFDSLSRNNFIRKLPKSYEYLVNTLQADVLQGYNIIGDGTPQALIPILTGQTELELPDTRKRFPNTEYVNAYPFIWNDFKDAGYVTAFMEDVPELSTFTYRLNGFNESPTDHYMRPYYLASYGERYKWPKLCAGETPRHNVMLKQVKDFFTLYKKKPKFMFAFHGEISHDDYNLVGNADHDLYVLLKDLKESGTLNNTILILMSDHGHRFAEVRNTIQGKQEERLPFFSFTFPKYFKKKYTTSYKNFQWNTDKLTTPFDIYTTLKSLLHLNYTGKADISQRGVSLFTEIPSVRSCVDAYIEPHWCSCLEWREVPLNAKIVQPLAKTVLDALNNETQLYRQICHRLDISSVQWVHELAPNEHLLKYKKNADFDGFVADLSARMHVNSNLYQISVILKPGESIFEASLTHFIQGNRIKLRMSDVSRVNAYGAQARCVEKNLPHLRKYCYCENNDDYT